jgi:ERCC4-type nuclease
MLLVDYRAGSKELIKPLAKILGKDNVIEESLDFGDIAFAGRGANGTSLDVGVEFKTIADIAQCCRDGRFAGHQLPGMRKTYDYSWLVVEGRYRHDANGLVTTFGRRGWTPMPGRLRASEFEKHLLTFELCGGIHLRHTDERADSVRFLSNLYRWWTDKALDSHSSHLAIHQPAALGETSDFRRAVMAWPGIGYKMSAAVEKEFKGSIAGAATADVFQWAEIATTSDKGKVTRMGRVEAEKLVKFLRGK